MSRAQARRRINVYDGARLLGVVREREDRRAWLARGPHDEDLGEHQTSRDAALAVTGAYDRQSADRLRRARA
jgi:hypothetical protein